MPMTLYEPPIEPDDTQPNIELATRPTIPSRQTKSANVVPSWMLLGLILLAITSLIATIGLAISRTASSEQRLDTVNISLRVAGIQRDFSTSALTVADVLDAENVTVGANDAVIPQADTPLTDGMVITVARARDVTLVIDGETTTIETPHDNPADILTQADVTVSEVDDVWVDDTFVTMEDLRLWRAPAIEIMVEHAHEVTIVEDGSQVDLVTTAETVGDALYEAGITIYLTDEVTPDITTSITSDMTVTIVRARPIAIHVDDTTIETRVQGNTVADALSEAGIALAGLDYTIPALTDIIAPDTEITVLRVTEALESTETVIPYETVYQADAQLELDQRRVIQAGQNGIERLNERVRFENGVEVSREPISTEIIQATQNQIVAYGTNIVIRMVNTPNGSREYWRVIRAYATSYHPEALGGDDTTAIGATLEFGVIASDPDIIPYRTSVFVPGYGIGMMADTGGARSSPYWVDLGYSDDDWVSWHEYVDVYLLTPIPQEIDYLLPNFTTMNGIPDN